MVELDQCLDVLKGGDIPTTVIFAAYSTTADPHFVLLRLKGLGCVFRLPSPSGHLKQKRLFPNKAICCCGALNLQTNSVTATVNNINECQFSSFVALNLTKRVSGRITVFISKKEGNCSSHVVVHVVNKLTRYEG